MKHIPKLLLLLGIVLLTTGTLLFIFDPPEAADKPILTGEVSGFKFGTRDRHLVLMIFGLTTIILGFRLPGQFGEVKAAQNRENKVPTTQILEEGGFTVSELEIRLDLSPRRDFGLGQYLGSELSSTERLTRLVLDTVQPGIREIHIRHATSGYSVEPLELPEKAIWRRLTTSEQAMTVQNPYIEFLRENYIFKRLIKNEGRMRTYFLTIPVTGQPGQEIKYKTRYNNAFLGNDFEWGGFTACSDCQEALFSIIFPENKPFKKYVVSKQNSDKKGTFPLTNPNIEHSQDRRTLTWKIENVKKGESYFIKWGW